MNERVTLLPAPASLQAHVVCIVRREVQGDEQAGALPGTVPANAYACLNLVARPGHVRLDESRELLPRAFVTGPFTAPLRTQAQAPLRSLSVVLQPWLLSHWFGLAPARMVNALQDLEDAALTDLLASVDQPERLAPALLALATRGERFEKEAAEARRLIGAVSQCTTVSEAAAMARLSERHFMRKFEVLLGLNPVAWRRVKRFESALEQMANEPASKAQLGHIALDSGYSDQAHMTREFRAITGCTPSALRLGLSADAPGLWAFKPALHTPRASTAQADCP
ncbi:helix-turn-helix domain-containing protein [Roseateles sp. DXS20W]|uniref:Helix-turn-helix domain-containing protein n=1 Tax=Pelomonas lactea TaxID=3299030 RepID=A0ABW7GJC1_9BURK